MDRFGEPPKPVQNLLQVAGLKSMAHRLWLTEVAQKGDSIRFTLFERAQLGPDKIEAIVRDGGGRLQFVMGEKPGFVYNRPRKSAADGRDVLTAVREVLEIMEKAPDRGRVAPGSRRGPGVRVCRARTCGFSEKKSLRDLAKEAIINCMILR